MLTTKELMHRLRNREHISREDIGLKAVHQLLLSAKTARELSDKGHKLKCEKEFNDIMKTIKNSATNGDYDYTIDGYISDENVKKLQDICYKVTIVDEDYGRYLYTEIEW